MRSNMVSYYRLDFNFRFFLFKLVKKGTRFEKIWYVIIQSRDDLIYLFFPTGITIFSDLYRFEKLSKSLFNNPFKSFGNLYKSRYYYLKCSILVSSFNITTRRINKKVFIILCFIFPTYISFTMCNFNSFIVTNGRKKE